MRGDGQGLHRDAGTSLAPHPWPTASVSGPGRLGRGGKWVHPGSHPGNHREVIEGVWMACRMLANRMGREHSDTKLLPTVTGVFSSANHSTWTSVQIIVFNYHLCIPSHATY